jgi:phosphoribosyl 1,2-cyclic phosphate phosphodiesterase
MNKITFLGTGPSGGVPTLLRGYGYCDPKNFKNTRTRSGLLLKLDHYTLLVDASSDIRTQLLSQNTPQIDALFLTHAHSDHMAGLDDLRFTYYQRDHTALPVFMDRETKKDVIKRFDYAFETQNERYPAYLTVQEINEDIIEIFPTHPIDILNLPHGDMMSRGFRYKNMAYCPDCHDVLYAEKEKLKNLDVLIIDCLRYNPHPTHMHVDSVMALFEELSPKKMILTHLGPELDYEKLKKELPKGMEPAYDGLKINF